MDNLVSKFKECTKNGYFIRVGDIKHNMFVGKDDDGRFCIEYRGNFKPTKLVGSKPLLINQYQTESEIILRFALESPELIGCFAAFASDLINAVANFTEEDSIYKILCDRFIAWKKLFKPNRNQLTEPEIMGLIGELLFLRDKAFSRWGINVALDSWMGPEKTHKDFSCDTEWFEIKTISAGKETVRISSIEQLDSDIDGFLYIYSLEKMSPTFAGIKSNILVNDILDILSNVAKDQFLKKLSEFGYDFSPEYDSMVFRIADENAYTVPKNFPRLERTNLPIAISKAQYDIILSDISSYKTSI